MPPKELRNHETEIARKKLGRVVMKLIAQAQKGEFPKAELRKRITDELQRRMCVLHHKVETRQARLTERSDMCIARVHLSQGPLVRLTLTVERTQVREHG